MNNDKRARAAAFAIEAHAVAKGQTRASQSLEENIVDLLTDLRHLCRYRGESFQKALKTSRMNYADERR